MNVEDRPLIAITGAAGTVGAITIRALGPHARLRLIDRSWSDSARQESAEHVTADLRRPHETRLALAGADIVVHLAANASPQQNAESAVDGAALLAANVADALERGGAKRLVFASSVHTMGMYDAAGSFPIRSEWAPRPCCEYGAAKVLTESLFELLHRRTGMPVVGLRLGLTGHVPAGGHYASQWLGDADYSRLIRAAVEYRGGYAAVFAMSADAAERWDLSETRRVLGVHATDRAVIVPPVNARHGWAERCLMLATAATDDAADCPR